LETVDGKILVEDIVKLGSAVDLDEGIEAGDGKVEGNRQ
jgi:hypothetical protein